MPVPGYSLVDCIDNSGYFLLHSAKSLKNGDLVLIKSLKEVSRDKDTINKLLLEHAFSDKLDHPNILKPINFINKMTVQPSFMNIFLPSFFLNFYKKRLFQ
ncbi:hypothetical protein [Pseudoalteromonas sp.]|uniref:hypothetical protein n=1 Tax=Pseudoalteromonas sp. TaxID=53249 RepID=UPI00261992C2|nr:hypothetical protein [Pseudoalteromonas sp.]MCP4585608.1 hypothetical protein [Pseudoalteromonas sp.]